MPFNINIIHYITVLVHLYTHWNHPTPAMSNTHALFPRIHQHLPLQYCWPTLMYWNQPIPAMNNTTAVATIVRMMTTRSFESSLAWAVV